jgi:PadR family transcriptional regulator, regulatory protein PadR
VFVSVSGRLAFFPLALLQELIYASVEVNEEMDRRYGLTGRIELPQGTLDLLILRTLLPGAQHGWAISERVQQVSRDVLSIQQGSLYPALHRLERRGWIRAQWGASDNNRRAKYYELTRAGKKQLERETEAWRKLSVAMEQVLEGA